MQSLAALENTVFVKTVFLAALVSCSQMLRPHHDCSTNAGMEFVNSDGRDFMVSDGRALDDLVWTVVSVLASGLAYFFYIGFSDFGDFYDYFFYIGSEEDRRHLTEDGRARRNPRST